MLLREEATRGWQSLWYHRTGKGNILYRSLFATNHIARQGVSDKRVPPLTAILFSSSTKYTGVNRVYETSPGMSGCDSDGALFTSTGHHGTNFPSPKCGRPRRSKTHTHAHTHTSLNVLLVFDIVLSQADCCMVRKRCRKWILRVTMRRWESASCYPVKFCANSKRTFIQVTHKLTFFIYFALIPTTESLLTKTFFSDLLRKVGGAEFGHKNKNFSSTGMLFILRKS